MYDKLVQLHSVLKSISEADETLQILSQFNSPSGIYLANQIAANGSTSSTSTSPLMSTLELPSNYWTFLNQAVMVKPYLLFNEKLTVLLRSTSAQANLGYRAAKSFSTYMSTDSPRSRYQVATIYLSRFLSSWSSLSLSKTSHIAWIFGNGPEASPTGICLLHLNWETESLMSLNFRFFAASLKECDLVVAVFKEKLGTVEYVNRHSPQEPIRPIYLCQKQVESFLIFYTPLELANTEYPTNLNQLFRTNQSPAHLYLAHQSWVWFSDIDVEEENVLESLIEFCFITFYNARVAEGFLRSAETSGSVTFYKECPLPDQDCLMSVQYIILYEPNCKFLCTQVWTESIQTGPKSHSIEFFTNLYERVIVMVLIVG